MPSLWPLQPEADIGEQLEWTTDIRQAATAEMRDSLADARQFLEFNYIWDAEEHAVAMGLIESAPAGEWYVPLWTDCTADVDVGSTDTTIAVDTDGDYVDGGQAVIWVSRTENQLVTITTVGSGVINLSAQVGTAYTDAVIAPIRTAIAPNGFNFQREFHNLVQGSMRFRITDTSQDTSTPFSQYESVDVITDVSFAREGAGGGIQQSVSLFDIGYGPVEIVSMRDVLENTYSFNWQDETLTAKKRRREWLKVVRGRDATFWLPSRAREMTLAVPALSTDTTISINPVLPAVAQYVGKHIAISGTIYREITAAAVNGTYHDLTIAAPGVALTDPEICFLRKYRLGTDTVDITHQSNLRSSGRVTVYEVAA